MSIFNFETLKCVTILLVFGLFSSAFCVNEISSSDNIEYGICAGAREPLYLAYLHYEPWPLLMVIIIIIIINIIMIIIRSTGPRSPSSHISSSSRRSPSTPA